MSVSFMIWARIIEVNPDTPDKVAVTTFLKRANIPFIPYPGIGWGGPSGMRVSIQEVWWSEQEGLFHGVVPSVMAAPSNAGSITKNLTEMGWVPNKREEGPPQQFNLAPNIGYLLQNILKEQAAKAGKPEPQFPPMQSSEGLGQEDKEPETVLVLMEDLVIDLKTPAQEIVKIAQEVNHDVFVNSKFIDFDTACYVQDVIEGRRNIENKKPGEVLSRRTIGTITYLAVKGKSDDWAAYCNVQSGVVMGEWTDGEIKNYGMKLSKREASKIFGEFSGLDYRR